MTTIGPVEWAVLGLFCTLLAGCLSVAWAARGILAGLQIQMAVKFAELEKDVRHTKRNIEQHANIEAEMLTDVTILKKDVERLAKIVNGGPHK